MNRLDQVSAYLTNNMTAEDVESFEIELLTDSALQAEVDDQLSLKRGLNALHQFDAKKLEPASQSLSFVPPTLLNRELPVVYVETMRGTETPVNIFGEPTQLSIDVGPSASFPFEVQLKTKDTVLVTETIEADGEGYVNLVVPKLPEGQYHCEIISAQISKTLLLSVTKK